MNCPNCGAPMALMATRPCWACGHCGSVVCSETAEGVRVTGETGHACPLCRIPLVRGVLDDRERIETCERCKGIFMPRRAFAVTLLARRRQPQTPVVAGAWTD